MQDSIEDSLTYLVIVLGLQIDVSGMRVERFAALALGDVFAIVNLSPELLPKCERTDHANSNSFASSERSTTGARSLSWVAKILYSFNGCFLASMPDSFVSSREKTQIEAIRLFRVYTTTKNGGVQREVSKFSVPLARPVEFR